MFTEDNDTEWIFVHSTDGGCWDSDNVHHSRTAKMIKQIFQFGFSERDYLKLKGKWYKENIKMHLKYGLKKVSV